MENEKRLIDANALLEKIQFRRPIIDTETKIVSDCVRIARETVVNAPTVDAVEVVHGEWMYYSTTMQECSNCHRHTARHKFKYCPHCGAVMEDRYYE